MSTKYLDLDTILAEEERLPCTFLIDAELLGFLDPSTPSTTLPSNTTVELPLWLSLDMFTKDMVSITTPKHFGPKMRNELDTNNTNVNLAGYSHYYFDVGLILAHFTKDNDLLRTMRSAFCGNRYLALMVHGLTSYHDDLAEFSQSLTSTEEVILEKGVHAFRDMIQWRSQRTRLLQPSDLSKRLLKSAQ